MFTKPPMLSKVLAFAVACSAWALVADAQTTQTWSGSPSSGNWNVAGNWTSGTAPVGNDSLAFGSTTIATATNNFTAGTQFNGITFNSGATTYTLSGNQIALGGSVINNSTATQTLSLPLALSATQSFDAASGGLTLSGVISGAGGLTKLGSGTVTLSGAAANTYTGATTVSAGALVLNKTAGVNAVAGDLAITNAAVGFTNRNQIADTAAVTMSGSNAFFNAFSGTSYNNGTAGNQALDETIGSLAVTGGLFFPGGSTSTTGFVVTGSASFTGGSGNTNYIQNSGGLSSYGSLSLSGMSSTQGVNGGISTPNQFVLAGNNASRQTTLTVGSGGLSLDGSNLLLQLGANSNTLGSRVVLNGDVTTIGSAASSIRPSSDTSTTGTRAVALSGTSGTVTRTFTVGGGGADLTVSVPITNGSATTAAITKAGSGTLTLSASNSYDGGTQINAGVLALGNANALGTTGTVSFGGGTLRFSGSNTTDYSSRFSTAASQAVSLDTNGQNVALASALTSSGGSLTKLGSGTLTLSGGVANTSTGTTTVSAGALNLNKPAGITAVAGDLVITNAIVTFGTSNQIADTAAVTMSGASSFYNNTAFNAGSAGNRNLDETIGSLTVTGGGFFPGGSSTQTTGFVVTGAGSFTGGAGNTQFIQTSGGLASFGSLSLTGLTSTVGTALSVISPNRFVVNGSDSTRQTTLTIGADGLTLDGSNLLLMLGSVAGNLGSRLILNGDVTTTGVAASAIRAPASDDNTIGTRAVALSGTSGTVTRTFTVGGGGADLAVSLPITNGSATTAGIIKAGLGTLTLSGTNTYTGATNVNAGTLAFDRVAALNSSGGIGIAAGTVLDYTGGTAGTLSRNVTVSSSGTGTIRNSGGQKLTLSGTLTKDGRVLRLTGGQFDVTGTIVGASANSDLVVDGTSTVTLLAANTYVGPTFVNQASNLIVGINNAIPSNSVVTLGDATTSGTLSLGSFSNAIGGLAFGAGGGTVRMAANQTASPQVATSAGLTLGSNASLDLTDMGTTAGNYRLISSTGITGTFGSVAGLDSNYLLRYGTVNANEVSAQRKAEFGTITATPAAVSIITGGSTAFTYTVANATPTGGTTLSFTSTNGSNVAGSSSGTAAANATSASIAGLVFTGTSVGLNQTGSFTLADANAIGSPANGSVLVNVLDHATSSLAGTLLTGTTISLGQWNYATSLWESGTSTGGFSIFNLASTTYGAGLTADLSLVGVSGTANGFTTNLGTYADLAGGSSALYSILFDTSGISTSGTRTATFLIQMSDKTGMSGATATNTLSVTAEVIVVPEPGALVLAAAGVGLAAAWARRRRRT